MYDYLLYFLIFSFLGWCAEVVFHVFKTGRLVNRGLARGPICPIYGIGICLSYFLLGSVENIFLLFLLSMAVATIVEFFVGFILDKVFGKRLWDYTEEKWNILGYVCPKFSVLWGIACAAAIRIVPMFNPILELAREPRICALVFIVSILAVIDIEREILKMIRGDIREKV